VSDTVIFAIGLFQVLLLGGGLAFTRYEMHRLNDHEGENVDETQASSGGSQSVLRRRR